MTFACKHYAVIGSGIIKSIFYGVAAAFYDHIVTTRASHALFYHGDYLHGVLGAGVVTCDNAKVCHLACYFAHNGALGAIAVTTAAKDYDNSAFGKAAHCREYVFNAVGSVGIVYENCVVSESGHNLCPALYTACTFEGASNL